MGNSIVSIEGNALRCFYFVLFFLIVPGGILLAQRLLKKLQYTRQFFVTGYSIQMPIPIPQWNKPNWPLHPWTQNCKLFLTIYSLSHHNTGSVTCSAEPLQPHSFPALFLQGSYCWSLSQCYVFPYSLNSVRYSGKKNVIVFRKEE